MVSMLMGLIGDHNQLHVLASLSVGPARFNELQRRAGLLPPQVDRALTKLQAEGFVMPQGLPPEGSRRPLAYALTTKGERAVRVLHDLEASAATHLGAHAAAELREVFAAHA